MPIPCDYIQADYYKLNAGAFLKDIFAKTVAEAKVTMHAGGLTVSDLIATGITIGSTTTTGIDITACAGRGLRIGTKGKSADGSLPITATLPFDTDPANNYLLGVFTKVASTAVGATDDLGSAWLRTRVDVGMATNASYSLFGAKSQLRIYASSGKATTISNWAAAGTYKIKIYGASNLEEFDLESTGSKISADISSFLTATRLTKFTINHGGIGNGLWTGSLDNFPSTLTRLDLNGYNTIFGSITRFTQMIYLDVRSANTISGSITNMSNLEICLLLGRNTISGNITNLTALRKVYLMNQAGLGQCTVVGDVSNLINITQLEGQTDISGTISNMTNLDTLCVAGNNTLTGWPANNTIHYFSCSGSNTLSGSISSMTNLYYLGVNSNFLTGSIANLTNLETCYGIIGITKPSTVATLTKLCYLVSPTAWTFTESEVNQILADFWANRDVARVYSPVSHRKIDIRGNAASAAPSGQGITDKTNLQAYRSPNNDPAYALWTVETR